MIQIRPDDLRYDDRHHLRLAGRGGLLDGEVAKVNVGETVFIGRSKRCALTPKRTPRYLTDRDGARARIRESVAYRSTSRRHFRLSYVSPDAVEIVNLSRNGTFVDGHRIDRLLLTDVRTRPHQIRLGAHGDVLDLTCGSVELEIPPRDAESADASHAV